MTTPEPFLELAEAAAHLGLRLEYRQRLGFVAEAMPSRRHQLAVQRIERSIRRPSAGACLCVHLADTLVRFPDGSFKRPDLSIWTEEPKEMDTAVTLVPAAVIEVISQGYEDKDLVGTPDWYLSQGVLDVVVLNPRTGEVLHVRKGATVALASPTVIGLECGCEVTV